MLQRIQTVWLVLATLGGLFLFITGRDVALFGVGNLSILLGCAALIVLGGYSIFSYKNRTRQLMLNKISIFINALLIGLLSYWLLNLPGGMDFPEKGIEPLFPLIAIVCLLIANIYIRRDDRLVKSVDRLR